MKKLLKWTGYGFAVVGVLTILGLFIGPDKPERVTETTAPEASAQVSEAPPKPAPELVKATAPEKQDDADKTTQEKYTLKIQWDDAGSDGIRVAFNTKLPDRAEVNLSVVRLYDGASDGKVSTYSQEYFSEEGNVGDWRKPRLIRLDDAAWSRRLQANLDKFSRIGHPTTGVSVRNEIEISAYVYGHKSGDRFGVREYQDRMAAIRGTELEAKDEVTVVRPLAAETTTPRDSVMIAGNKLKAGKTYKLLSEETPLMAAFRSQGDIEQKVQSLARTRYLPATTLVTVVKVVDDNGTPWYRMALPEYGGKEGWINSIALLRDGVREVASTKALGR